MIVKGKIEIELNSIILYKIVDNDMVLYIKSDNGFKKDSFVKILNSKENEKRIIVGMSQIKGYEIFDVQHTLVTYEDDTKIVFDNEYKETIQRVFESQKLFKKDETSIEHYKSLPRTQYDFSADQRGLSGDYVNSFRKYIEGAQNCDIEMQKKLGNIYYYGYGTD